MIARLLRGGIWMLVYFCVATVIAEVIMLVYLASTWHLDRNKVLQILAIAQGVDLFAVKGHLRPDRDEASPEQVSHDQVLEARVVKVHHLELREQALKAGLDQLRFEQNKLAEEKNNYHKTKGAFEEALLALQKQTTETGWDENRRALLAIKPKQAKELLLQMLEKNEINEVVTLMAPMADSKRAKIISEFKTADELKKIDEVLRLIRQGQPASDLTAKTQQQLGQTSPSGRQGTP